VIYYIDSCWLTDVRFALRLNWRIWRAALCTYKKRLPFINSPSSRLCHCMQCITSRHGD